MGGQTVAVLYCTVLYRTVPSQFAPGVRWLDRGFSCSVLVLCCVRALTTARISKRTGAGEAELVRHARWSGGASHARWSGGPCQPQYWPHLGDSSLRRFLSPHGWVGGTMEEVLPSPDTTPAQCAPFCVAGLCCFLHTVTPSISQNNPCPACLVLYNQYSLYRTTSGGRTDAERAIATWAG